jgi:hypothetical protein
MTPHLAAAYANQLAALDVETWKLRLENARHEALRRDQCDPRIWLLHMAMVAAGFVLVLPSFLWWSLLLSEAIHNESPFPIRWWITPHFHILPWAWILIGLTASTWVAYGMCIRRIRAWQDSRRVRYVDLLMNRSEATKSRQCPRCLAPNLNKEQGTCTVCGFALPSV